MARLRELGVPLLEAFVFLYHPQTRLLKELLAEHRVGPITQFSAEMTFHLDRDPGDYRLSAALGGGCQLPLGALATIDGDALTCHGLVAATDGERIVRVRVSGNAATPEAVGTELAQQAIDAGADEIIREAS